jgi:hypothetical protein
MGSIADGSPRRLAPARRGLYLINILGGAYAITIVPAMLVVQGDLAATPTTSRPTSCCTGPGWRPTWWSPRPTSPWR